MADLLEIEDLSVTFRLGGRRHAPVRAVDRVSFTVKAGETVGLVGESGSGKTTIGRAILGLEVPSGGTVRLAGETITGYRAGSVASIAEQMQVVFQDPYSSLNPSRTIGKTLAEPLELRGISTADADARVRELLAAVRLPSDAAQRYPHSFSGGQRQRIAIARALATAPKLIICDEAVSALDLVTRAQVLNLLLELQQTTEASFLFIAHDLPIVCHISHRAVVLYHGQVMEQGPAQVINDRPLHPYSQALLAAVPVANPIDQRARREARAVRTTTANAAAAPEAGCPFAPRCLRVSDVCWNRRPASTPVGPIQVACHLYDPASGHREALPPAEVADLANRPDAAASPAAG